MVGVRWRAGQLFDLESEPLGHHDRDEFSFSLLDKNPVKYQAKVLIQIVTH